MWWRSEFGALVCRDELERCRLWWESTSRGALVSKGGGPEWASQDVAHYSDSAPFVQAVNPIRRAGVRGVL